MRRPFLIACMVFAIPGLVGLTFATGYRLLMLSGFIFGFFIMSAGRIGFQYAAEITYPTSEATSQGLIIMMRQISGIIFILCMDKFRTRLTKSMTPFMIVFIALSFISVFMCIKIKESKVIKTDLLV